MSSIHTKYPGGAEVALTMLFVDVRGSTSLTEKMSAVEFSRKSLCPLCALWLI